MTRTFVDRQKMTVCPDKKRQKESMLQYYRRSKYLNMSDRSGNCEIRTLGQNTRPVCEEISARPQIIKDLNIV